MCDISRQDGPFRYRKEAKMRMKVCVASITILFLLTSFGCSSSHEFSSVSVSEESSQDTLLKTEGVRVVEKYFQAVAENRKYDANALMSQLVKTKVVVDLKEVELKNLEARQSEHSIGSPTSAMKISR